MHECIHLSSIPHLVVQVTGRNPTFEWREAFGKAGYKGAPLAVGYWLGNHWNGDGKHPLAPVELIMKDTGYSRRSVTLALARLRDDGWAAIISRGGRRGTAAWVSRYRLTVPMPEVPNVQSTAPQCATGCTPVDQTGVDQTTPPGGIVFKDYEAEQQFERERRKWFECPDYPWSIPYEERPPRCPQCGVNDGCAVRLAQIAREDFTL